MGLFSRKPKKIGIGELPEKHKKGERFEMETKTGTVTYEATETSDSKRHFGAYKIIKRDNTKKKTD